MDRGTVRLRLTAGLGALVVMVAGCGDDDDPVPDADATDAAADETTPADEAATTDESDEGGEPDAEPVDGLSIVFDGEELVGTGVRCEEDTVAAGALDVDMIEVDIVAPDGLGGAFRAMWDLDAGQMHRVVVSFEHEEFEYETYNVDWRHDEVVGEIEFTAEVGASGELELKASDERAEEIRPDGGTVVFDVDCDA